MEQAYIKLGNKDCRVYMAGQPEALLIQPMDEHELKSVDQEIAMIAEESGSRFAMAAFNIEDWEKELMPWPDRAVSSNAEVGHHATDTLSYIEQCLLPWSRHRWGELPCLLGGCSLSALFALWASTQVDSFVGIAASSPSVWIKDWINFARENPTKAQHIYLSLGDQEEHVKNKVFAQVGNNIRQYHDMLTTQIGDTHTTLVWNVGNHFRNSTERTANGFVWCLKRMEKEIK